MWTILECAIFLLIVRRSVLHIPIGQSAIVSVINDSLTYRFSINDSKLHRRSITVTTLQLTFFSFSSPMIEDQKKKKKIYILYLFLKFCTLVFL